MPQSIILAVSGIYTSGNDFNGLPPGALDDAVNVESRYKNTLEPRRGFDQIDNTNVSPNFFPRITNFYVSGTDRLVGLRDDGDVYYYNGSAWAALAGNSTGIINPNDLNGKSRFIKASQNLYLTSQDGIRSLSSGTSAQMIRAGVPKGLNLEAATNADVSGFFTNNTVLTTTGNLTNLSAIITTLADITGVTEDMYVAGTNIPAGTTVSSITAAAGVSIQTGDTTIGSNQIINLASTSGLVAGVFVTGSGLPDGAKITSLTGSGPYTANLNVNAFRTATGTTFTFTTPATITMSASATGSSTGTTLTFYSGSQVGYRLVFGRTETDINGGMITRLGAPTSIAIATNILSTSTNVSVTATLPKNSDNEITFFQLYRSAQTDSIDISPLDQYNLVYERELTASDFTNRVITVTDELSDSLVGIPLYAGTDREGILQSNDPPPMAWDMCPFRDFMLYVNATQPSTLDFTILAVGPASGVQINDVITVSGTFAGVAFSRTYTGKSTETQASREFKVVTSGTASQNITDTALSLIRVINYDQACPVHAIYLSSTTDLPGQILLEYDQPSLDTFTITASLHKTAYDPELDNLESMVNTSNNGVLVSKTGELEAVPATNVLYAGDTSANILRVIPLRDYVFVIKTDGIYKIQGLTPSTLICSSFDLTTKIIGAETAVPLNSGVWMFSNQGVVSISDGGVDAKSIPIDDQLNTLIGSYLDSVTDVAFAMGYESDRKYILAVPNADNTFTQTQYVFNYVTNAWTKWERNLRTGFIHSNEGNLYISRADDENDGISKERKTGTYQDYVDEALDVTITVIDESVITLSTLDGVEVGGVLYQDSTTFSPIVDIDLIALTVTVQTSTGWTLGAAQVLPAYRCLITWKQVFGDNPAFVRQFSEGIALFKTTRFNTGTLSFTTDFSNSTSEVEIEGPGNGLWGLFAWGSIPWGGGTLPQNIRFLIPQYKQLGSYIIPTLTIQQGYSNFKFQGLSISHSPVSQEVGK